MRPLCTFHCRTPTFREDRKFSAATNQPAVREPLLSQGHILTLSPQAFAARISAEIKQNADVIRRANIKVD